MRLLIVVNVPWFFVMHRLPIALMARARGFDVHIACGQGEGRGDIEAAGFTFHRLPLTRAPFAPWSDIKSIVAMLRLYRRLRPDIVHHVTLKPVIFGSIAARLTRVPGVVNAFAGLGHAFSGRSLAARTRRWAIERLLEISLKLPRHKVVFENDDDRTLLIDAGSVARADSLVIAGIGVDTEKYAASVEPPPPVCVLLAGRMLREKGVRYFVDAARQLKARGVVARFVLAGTPDPFSHDSITEEELRGWSRDGIVEWLGFQADMVEVVRAAHIVCLPTYYREGVPRILMEGAACARALVATDVPGCRDIVVDGCTGFVVPPHDVPALAAALERLIADSGLRAQFGAAARRIAEQRFALPLVLEKFWNVYLSVAPPELVA